MPFSFRECIDWMIDRDVDRAEHIAGAAIGE
jgi:hypothetical protein